MSMIMEVSVCSIEVKRQVFMNSKGNTFHFYFSLFFELFCVCLLKSEIIPGYSSRHCHIPFVQGQRTYKHLATCLYCLSQLCNIRITAYVNKDYTAVTPSVLDCCDTKLTLKQNWRDNHFSKMDKYKTYCNSRVEVFKQKKIKALFTKICNNYC